MPLLFLSSHAFSNGFPHYQTINFEAEDGVLTAPMKVIYDEKASADLFVYSNDPNATGKVDFYFNTIATGTFIVWARVLSPDQSTDSFYMTMDSGLEDVFDTSEGSWGPNWQWSKVGGRNGTSVANTIYPRTFLLNPGLHVLHFKAREINTKLDKVIVTSDLSITSTTLNGTPIFHPCPTLPTASNQCLQNIIQYQIKPIYESTSLSDLDKCKQIQDVLVRKINPLIATSEANLIQLLQVGCGTCAVRNAEEGCPWEVPFSSP